MISNRNIVTKKTRMLDSGNELNNYLDRLKNLIPADIIAVYLTVTSLLREGPIQDYIYIYWPFFILCSVLTPIYLHKFFNVSNKGQLLFSFISFIGWSLAIGNPFETIFHHTHFIGGLSAPILTLFIPLIYKGKME